MKNLPRRSFETALIILSTHGHTGFNRLLMGSVAEELFRSLPCPVLSVGPHLANRLKAQAEVKQILFPTDLSQESQAVFPYLALIASEYKAHLQLLHVLPVEKATNPEAKALAEPLRKQMEYAFSPYVPPMCSAEFVIDSGDLSERILAHAHASQADLIGLGVRKAAEATTHLCDTAAYKVVVGAECPVLTARANS